MKLSQIQAGDYFRRLSEILSEIQTRPDKPYELPSYTILPFDLGTARDGLELLDLPVGNRLYVFALTAESVVELQFGKKDGMKVKLTLDDSFNFQGCLSRLWISNDAQADKSVQFLISKGINFSRK